jgi:hypothetical protein
MDKEAWDNIIAMNTDLLELIKEIGLEVKEHRKKIRELEERINTLEKKE